VSRGAGRWIGIGAVALILVGLCGGGVAAGVAGWMVLRPPSLAADGGVEMVLRTDAEHRDEAMAVIRSRLDEGAIHGALVEARDDDRIVVQVPGMAEGDSIVDLLTRQAHLEFLEVSTNADTFDLTAQAEAFRRDSAQAGELIDHEEVDAYLQSLLLGDLEVRWSTAIDEISGKRIRDEAYALHPEARVDGTMIANARVSTDQFNEPYVQLEFNETGREGFCQLSDEIQGSLLAIVVDGEVLSAPKVLEPICGGEARITMGSHRNSKDVLQQAQDLAIALRAGALPAPVEYESVTTIGPAG
jgi:preprotein translocase subunit SecD